MKTILLTFALSILPLQVLGQGATSPLEVAAKRANGIYLVNIESGVRCSERLKCSHALNLYGASAVATVKGAERSGKLAFLSEDHLSVGNRYLVFAEDFSDLRTGRLVTRALEVDGERVIVRRDAVPSKARIIVERMTVCSTDSDCQNYMLRSYVQYDEFLKSLGD